MKKKINKKFFILSLTIHLLVILISISLNTTQNQIKEKFLVFGVHSKMPTQAIFKSNKNIKTTDWLAKRRTLENNKKAAFKKQQKCIKKIKTKPSVKQKKKINTPTRKRTSLRKEKNKLPPKKVLGKEKSKKRPQETSKFNINKHKKIHFNLMGSDNPKLIKLQESIQREVTKHWKPPIGVKKGTECTVKFVIDNNGNVMDFEILNKSNVLLYDLSIIRVAKKFKFNKFLWGKEFSIDFRQ